ncbi:MAG TPA: zinc ribbon domain-containing protein [Herpetosiphonaceae bacterium]
MAQADNEENNSLWQAQVLLEHQRRRKFHAITTLAMLFVILVMGITPLLLSVLFEIEIFEEIGRNGLVLCFLPLLVPIILASIIVWRCPACDALLGRGDPQFCPHCGAQLRFLDE